MTYLREQIFRPKWSFRLLAIGPQRAKRKEGALEALVIVLGALEVGV